MTQSNHNAASTLHQAHLACIVEQSFDALISKDVYGIVQSWNRAAERIFGWTADEIIGEPISRIYPDDRILEEDSILQRIRSGEVIERFETVRRDKQGHRLNVAITVSPLTDRSGKVIGASTIAHDISRAELQANEVRFRTLVNSIPQLAWIADRQGAVCWYNNRWYEYAGTTVNKMHDWKWARAIHPEHLERVKNRIQRSLETGEEWEDTFPLRGKDGSYRWFLSRAVPLFREDGSLWKWIGTHTDVTAQQEHEQRAELLMNEINHRVKNILTLIQAIAHRTFSSSPKDLLDRFDERIQSLVAAQDLLINNRLKASPLADLVHAQLSHFSDLFGTRIFCEGPPVSLTSKASQAIGMALHELATNAAKYGAISNEAGRVDVVWSLEHAADGQKLFIMRWLESGGPPVPKPKRQGFGSVIIAAAVEMSIGGTVFLDHAPTGVRWCLTCDAQNIEGGDETIINVAGDDASVHRPGPTKYVHRQRTKRS